MSSSIKVRDFYTSSPTTSATDRRRNLSPQLTFSTPRRPTREQDITDGYREFITNYGTPRMSSSSSPTPYAEQLFSPTIGARTGGTPRRPSIIENLRLPDGAIGTDFYDGAQGDLYRDSASIPAQYTSLAQRTADNEVAVEDESDSSDSSSLSGLDLGRRITRAVGGALRRRGSGASSSSSSDGENNSIMTDKTGSNKRSRRRSRRSISRGLSFATQRSRTDSMDSTAKSVGTRRQILPVHREFILLMPSGSALVLNSMEAAQNNVVPGETQTHQDQNSRLLTTPVLTDIISAIRSIRNQSNYFAPQRATKSPPPSASASDPEIRPYPKSTKAKRTKRSRLDQLRQDLQEESSDAVKRTVNDVDVAGLNDSHPSLILRPKSASDVLGLGGHVTIPHLTGKKHPRQPREFALPPRVLMTPPLSTNAERPDPFSLDEAIGKLQSASNLKTAKDGGWWLDVSCPGWKDLRDLGELLHLHPLTLEDVLQREPREKIDVYEGLGYYFIVFRAIDETYFRYTAPATVNSQPAGGVDPSFSSWSRRMFARAKSRLRRKHGMSVQETLDDVRANDKGRVEIVEDRPGKEGLEGVGVGGLNVYLAVFPDGVVSFHFDDISKHTAHVRDRLLTMRDNVSADWIAHGLLDSIVDAFFPLISYIDEEVDIIDSLVADPSTDPRAPFKKPTAAESLAADYLANIPANEEHIELQDRKDYLNSPPSSGGSPNSLGMKNSGVLERVRKSVTSPFNPIARWCSRKQMPVRQRLHHASLLVSTSTPMLYARFFARRTGTVLGLYGKKQRKKQILPDPIFDRREMLRRMTEMRRLVTGMTRLLGFKHQVVSRLKRRAGNEGGEVGAYIGDVHDHICMLETSLLHHENVLNHCQSAYISHIGVSFALVRGQTDQSILALSVVSIGVLPMQFVVSMFSLNVHIPCNGDRFHHLKADGTPAPFNGFFMILAAVVVIGAGVLSLVKLWKVQAAVKWSRINALRAANTPVPAKAERQRKQRWALKWPLTKKTE